MSGQKRNLDAEQAAADLARLYQVTTQAPNIDSWQNQSSDYQRAFMESVEIMAELEALADDPDIAAAAGRPVSPGAREVKTRNRWPQWAVAATVVLGVAVTFALWRADTGQTVSGTDVQRYVTRVGEQKTVALPDGSSITLNTGTQLLVEWLDQGRKVTLQRGEAFFDVAGDATRPFSVELGAQSITVLGTSFNVRAEPGGFELAVIDGLVAVHPITDKLVGNEPTLELSEGGSEVVPARSGYKVTADTLVRYRSDVQTLAAYFESDVARFQQWRTGQLRFEYEPLMNVVRELNRYSAKKILIEDDRIMNMKVYALVSLERLDSALMGLEATMPIKITKHFDRIVIVGDNKR